MPERSQASASATQSSQVTSSWPSIIKATRMAGVIPSRAVPRSLVWILYAGCVVVWSSTWVVIAVGLDGVAPFLGAGIRFALAGAGVLAAARLSRRPLRTDWRLSGIVGVLPFATTYGLEFIPTHPSS